MPAVACLIADPTRHPLDRTLVAEAARAIAGTVRWLAEAEAAEVTTDRPDPDSVLRRLAPVSPAAARPQRAGAGAAAQAAPAVRHGQHDHHHRMHRRAGRLRRHQAPDRRRDPPGHERRARLRRRPSRTGGVAGRTAERGHCRRHPRTAGPDAGCADTGADDAGVRRLPPPWCPAASAPSRGTCKRCAASMSRRPTISRSWTGG